MDKLHEEATNEIAARRRCGRPTAATAGMVYETAPKSRDYLVDGNVKRATGVQEGSAVGSGPLFGPPHLWPLLRKSNLLLSPPQNPHQCNN